MRTNLNPFNKPEFRRCKTSYQLFLCFFMKTQNSIGESGNPITEYIPENKDDEKQIRSMMLNGTVPSPPDTKNWVRLCAAIDGFYVRYGRWPTRVRIHPISLDDIRDSIFTPEDFAKIKAKIVLVNDDAPMLAEDDSGGSYDYSSEGFPTERPKPSAVEWLGVQPRESIFDGRERND